MPFPRVVLLALLAASSVVDRAFAQATVGTSAAPRDAASAQVRYSSIDAATVRVLTIGTVDVRTVSSRSGPRVLAMPNFGHGTGVLVTADGWVITANHVVEGARHVVVRTPGSAGRYFVATVVLRQPDRDIAILHVEGAPIGVAPPEASAVLDVRQTVYAVGYPVDASRTTAQSSRGIVAGALENGDLQLDIALNPGNSGGPLIDEGNRIVGMVVARGNVERGIQGIGIAVPAGRLRAALDDAPNALPPPTIVSSTSSVADTVDRLVREDAMRSFEEAAELPEGDAVRSASLSWIRERMLASTDPDLTATLAGIVWDVAQVIMHKNGGVIAPWAIPEGNPNRQLVSDLMRETHDACVRAIASDPTLARRSPFVEHAARLDASAFSLEPPANAGISGSPPTQGFQANGSLYSYGNAYGGPGRKMDGRALYAELGLPVVAHGASYLGGGVGVDLRFGVLAARFDGEVRTRVAGVFGTGVAFFGIRHAPQVSGLDRAATFLFVPLDLGLAVFRRGGMQLGLTYSPGYFLQTNRSGSSQFAPLSFSVFGGFHVKKLRFSARFSVTRWNDGTLVSIEPFAIGVGF